MKKVDLIAEVENVVSSFKEAKAAVNTVFGTIMKSLKKRSASNNYGIWNL